MHLLYITFGNHLHHHTQAHFSIYSFLSQSQEWNSIHIVTDHPAFYQTLEPRVKITVAEDGLLKEWKGEHDFFWRIKIKAIELLCNRYPGEPVLYLDTDTFLYNDGAYLGEAAANGIALMHEKEGLLPEAKSKTEKRMWRQVKHRVFGGVQVRPAHAMWNAGVVLVPNTKAGAECRLALQICDEMCAHRVTRRLVEQYALSVALQETYTLQPAATSIAHYWSNKDAWNELIGQFFLSAYLHDSSGQAVLEAFGRLNLSALPVKKKIRNTRLRLQQLTARLFPEKNLVHVNGATEQQT